MLVLKKVKQLLSNFEAERWENLSNLRLAKKSVAYKKNWTYSDWSGRGLVEVAKDTVVSTTSRVLG